MDDRTYRRLFHETYLQTFMRHNRVQVYGERRCRTCNSLGSKIEPKDCHRCAGTGFVSYRRTR